MCVCVRMTAMMVICLAGGQSLVGVTRLHLADSLTATVVHTRCRVLPATVTVIVIVIVLVVVSVTVSIRVAK